jgi:trimethylamine---corrinoid protein Co-methyltransferase
VSEENLGFDAICDAVLGDGHFLGSDQTMQAMERDYVYPSLSDRDEPRTWQLGGASSAWDRARDKAKLILAEHHPSYLSPDQLETIHKKFELSQL